MKFIVGKYELQETTKTVKSNVILKHSVIRYSILCDGSHGNTEVHLSSWNLIVIHPCSSETFHILILNYWASHSTEPWTQTVILVIAQDISQNIIKVIRPGYL